MKIFTILVWRKGIAYPEVRIVNAQNYGMALVVCMYSEQANEKEIEQVQIFERKNSCSL